MTLQSKAVTTPVEVERWKDLCFIRIRGDHHTHSFLFHYESLVDDEAPPLPRSVELKYRFTTPSGLESLWESKWYHVPLKTLIHKRYETCA